VDDRQSLASMDRLRVLQKTFRHSVWINPQPEEEWNFTWTVGAIAEVFPMYPLTLDGLDRAVQFLVKKN